MDSAITLPIIGRVGLDAVLDLIPVFGNFAGAAVSLTLIARTLQYGPPPSLVSKMLSNVLVDVILGGIPVIGPLVDIWFRANDRNAALMREFLDIEARDRIADWRRPRSEDLRSTGRRSRFSAPRDSHVVPEHQRVEHHRVLAEGLPAVDRIVREHDHATLADGASTTMGRLRI